MKKRKGRKGQQKQKDEKKEQTHAPCSVKDLHVPPPESELWPEFCRGERWRPIFAYLLAGKCQLCAYSCPQPRASRLLGKCAGLPTLLVCTNHPNSAGELRDVLPTETCRNFKAKCWWADRLRKANAKIRPNPPALPTHKKGVRRILLSQGLFATVDAADYEKLSKYKWYVVKRGSKVYATRRKGKRYMYMHREIMRPPRSYVVDHIDGNGLNNCRSNLRVCTARQNQANRGPRGGSSRFVGVHRHGNKWEASIRYRGELLYLGRFDDEVEAAKARDRKAYELHGEYAYLNFPEDFRR
jgi:hypothetical protein